VVSAHGGYVDVYITVPEKPESYAIIRTKEDLGSEAKSSGIKKQEKKLPQSKKERPFLEKKIHHIRQSLQFLSLRLSSKWRKIQKKK
jgi:hypothetical protein